MEVVDAFGKGVLILLIIIAVGMWSGTLYIAWHFVSKFW